MKKTQKKAALKKKAPSSLSNSVYDTKGKRVGEFQLDAKLFDGGVNIELLHRTVLMHQARQRSGTASTKIRCEVRGGGKKPWRQKGTGRARVGSIRNPIWRGGGVAFGPHPRDYSYSLPARMKKQALKSGLNSKFLDGRLQVLDKLEINEPKTKLFKAVLDSLKIKGTVLVILDNIDENIKKSSRNIPGLNVKTFSNFNTLDVLRHENLIVTESALKLLSKRLA